MEYVLTVRSLSKKYKHFQALNDFSMNIPKGSIYGFIGKNGAGKTTLIRLICGLQKPTLGNYTLYGIKNTDSRINESQKRMGAIIETPSLYLNMSAQDNIKHQYRILGMPSFQGISELLELVGLQNTGNKKVRHFSLGMRQRLAIAVALAGEPDFLILDEPTNGLDPSGIVELRELILKLNHEKQITVLISSHHLDELSKLATYYGFINHGSMVKEISAEDLEKICRKCLRIAVSSIQILGYVMDALKLEYKIVSDHEADIFGDVNVSQLVMALTKENCEIMSISEHDESLENFYINLIGGQE